VNNLAGVFGAAVDSAQKAKFVKHAKQPGIQWQMLTLEHFCCMQVIWYIT